PPTYIYTLSLHDALPIFCSKASRKTSREESPRQTDGGSQDGGQEGRREEERAREGGCKTGAGEARRQGGAGCRACTGQEGCCQGDRKSTRLNSSHLVISY